MTTHPTESLPAPPSDAVTAVQRILLRELLDLTRTLGNVAWLLEEEARRQQRQEAPHA